LDSHRPEVTEEMKKFLQEGLRTYAPALIALSEFRRQIRSRLQTVLDEFSMKFSRLGLSVSDLRPAGVKLDDEDLGQDTSWIGLKKNHGAELYTDFHVQWNLEEPKDEQVWVGVSIYVGVRSDRDRLFGALQKQRLPSSETDLVQYADGSPYLSRYCESDLFYTFDQTFRMLIEEWVGLLSGVGGIQPFLSTAAVSRLYSAATSEEP
jgi:hypothetical protein